MRPFVLSLAFLTLAAPAQAEHVVIDLASITGPFTYSRPAGTELTFEIQNKLPTAEYSVVITTAYIPIPALDAPDAIGIAASNDCDGLLAASDSVYTADDEGSLAVPMKRIALAVGTGACPGPIGDRLALTLMQTRLTLPGKYTVRSGEEIVVTITRGDKVWTYRFSGGSRGSWLVTYGAAVFANRDRRMTLKGDDEGGYVVTPEADPGGVRVLPSVFFTWMPTRSLGRDWEYGPTAGLGIDDAAPGLFAGWTATYNQNLTFIGGVSLAKHLHLRGKYSEGDVLEANLDADQLLEGVYKPSWLIGITFRFGENPFGKKPTEAEKESEEDDGAGSD